jgi:hypothetical protein
MCHGVRGRPRKEPLMSCCKAFSHGQAIQAVLPSEWAPRWIQDNVLATSACVADEEGQVP